MIRVRRPARPVPKGLLTDACRNQITAAKKLFRLKRNWPDKAKLTAYNNQSVKDELEALFHNKCAYCETQYGANSPMEIEHFRPKGGVMVDDDFQPPGYYWLAVTWGNLLPSCIDCNRRRRQRMPDGEIKTAGKANQFPLSNEGLRKSRLTARSWKEGAEAGERPLLLNPCTDEPADHLKIRPDGLAVAKSDRRGRPSPRGEATIFVCALNRFKLRRSRAAVRTRLVEQVQQTKFTADAFDRDPREAGVQRRFAGALRELRSFRDEDHPYLLMTRDVTEAILKEFGGVLRKHRQAAGLPGGKTNRALVDLFIAAHPVQPERITDDDLRAIARGSG